MVNEKNNNSAGKLVDYVLLFLMLFIDYRVAMLTVSDVAIILFLIKIFLSKRNNIATEKANLIIGGLILLIALIPFGLYLGDKWFDVSGFVLSWGKFLIYMLAVIMISDYILVEGIDYRKLLKIFMYLIIFGAFFQWLIVIVLGPDSWPLYSLGSGLFGINYNNMVTVSGLFRARSFYSEPAHYSVHLSMVFCLLFFASKRQVSKVDHLLYILGVVLSLSISGVFLMLMTYCILNIEFIKKNITIAASFMVIAVIAVIIILSTDNYVGMRIKNTLSLKDSSGVVRTVGGFMFLEYVPFTGVGIGNVESFYNSLDLPPSMWFSGNGNFYNNILLSIICLGYIGTFLWLTYQWILLKDNILIFWILIISHFAWGKFNVSVVWVFLIFGTVISRLNKKRGISRDE